MVEIKPVSFRKILEETIQLDEMDYLMFPKNMSSDECFILHQDEPTEYEDDPNFFYLQIAEINGIFYNLREEIDDFMRKNIFIKYDVDTKKKALYYYAKHDAYMGFEDQL